MSKGLAALLVIQLAALGYLGVGGIDGKTGTASIDMKVSVVLPDIEEEMVSVDPPKIPEEKVDPFGFDIPDRRRMTNDRRTRTIDLDKNVNIMSTVGEAMMENPVFLRGIEKAIRAQFAEFYADFVKEANLSPEEQIELFKIMSSTMQDNIKSMMTAMGDNMGQMEEMFKGGPPAELIEGIKENNLEMKDGFIATLGEERFELFEQYHREKSAAESFTRLKGRLNSQKVPMSEDQETEMRKVMLDDQKSPFREDSYKDTQTHPSENSGGILDEKQQKVFQGTRKRHNRLLLLPF